MYSTQCFCYSMFHVFTLEKTGPMIRKSKQQIAEDNKTANITDLAKLRFKMLKPCEGVIEVVNCADQGRICTLKVSDFDSVQDAQAYGQLLVLAPQILRACLTDAGKLEQVVGRYKKYRVEKEKQKKYRRYTAKKRTAEP